MQTKNLTPFLFGTKVTSLSPPQVQMTMIVRATFRLKPGEPLTPIEGLMDQGPLRADVLSDDEGERVGECTYPSDFADFKLNSEVFLVGTCHTPSAKPLSECPVRFSVGKWSKSLLVTGRRVWTEKLLGAGISDPHPFTSMQLGFANAFGGPSYPMNPVGKGHETAELPNVEHPAARVRNHGDRPEPASFGPLNPTWPQRTGKLGKNYGKDWKKERAPFYADDFDWTHFNAAPLDQQIADYLRGDEELSFVNLHPTTARFSVRLPGLRVRAFAKDTHGVVREPPMKLDTLFADVDNEKVVLTWRGIVPVTEDDLADVRTVLIASEALDSQHLSEAHYIRIIEAFEANPHELDERVPGGPKLLESMKAAAKDDAEHPERTQAERALALLDHADGSSMAPEEHRAGLMEAIASAKSSLASAPAMPVAPEGGPTSAEAMTELIAKTTEAVKTLRAMAAKAGAPLDDVEQIEKMLDDPSTKRAIAMMSPPRPEEIGPGKDLSDRNLGRMDLSGRDLSGCKLDGANLMGANLRGARLVSASLKQAILAQADLSDADLSNADLTRTLFGGARAPRANLRGATIAQTVFQDVDLSGAIFDEAKGLMLVLIRSNLTDASFRHCDLEKALFDDSVLDRADLSDSKLVRCSILRVKAEGAQFARAVLTSSAFLESELRHANFSGARGEGVNWIRAVLDDASFRLGVFPGAHFMGAKGKNVKFFGADLRRSELYRASFDDADFEKSNLFAVSFNKAKLNRARFVDANLYDARFLGASGVDCDFNGANLKRAMLPS